MKFFFFNFNRSLFKIDLFSSHKLFNLFFIIIILIIKGRHLDGLYQCWYMTKILISLCYNCNVIYKITKRCLSDISNNNYFLKI